MTRRVWLRAAALVCVVLGAIVGLTVYFSSEREPPCLASGAPQWRPPADAELHRYMVAFPDRAACFFALDGEQALVGAVRLDSARDPTVAAPLRSAVALRAAAGPYVLDLRRGTLARGGVAPFDRDTLTLLDPEHRVLYVTQRDLLGFRVIDLASGRTLYVVHFRGFTWNLRFGPNPPSHGLALAPDRPELWVLDAPNRTLHVFDVSALPARAPRRIEDVRLERTLSTPGSLLQSADGKFLYVGGSGDVVDARTRESVAQLAAVQKSRALLEVDWVDGKPFFPGYPR